MVDAEEWERKCVAYASAARKIQADALRHAAKQAKDWNRGDWVVSKGLEAEADELDRIIKH